MTIIPCQCWPFPIKRRRRKRKKIKKKKRRKRKTVLLPIMLQLKYSSYINLWGIAKKSQRLGSAKINTTPLLAVRIRLLDCGVWGWRYVWLCIEVTQRQFSMWASLPAAITSCPPVPTAWHFCGRPTSPTPKGSSTTRRLSTRSNLPKIPHTS